jgi:hypothetical protein
MKAFTRAFSYALLFAVGVSSACIDADERTLNPSQATGGTAGSSGAVGPTDGGAAAGSSELAGAANEPGAGADSTGGTTFIQGGAASGAGDGAGGSAGGGAGGSPEPVDDGILSEWALWSVPNSPNHNLNNLFNYDTDDADVTIDQVTGLTWQKHALGTALTWQEAMDACDALTLGAKDDWRLPTRMELVSILDYDKTDPATDSDAFPATKHDYYWASSVAVAAPNRHWQVDFSQGSVFPEDSAQKYYARCVRGKTKVPPTHYTAGTGVVTDNYTHLMWEMPKPGVKETLAEAKFRCENLDLGGATDWRLPSMNELQTLVDVTAIDPAIDSSVFTDAIVNMGDMDWSQSTRTIGGYWVVQWAGGVTPSDDGNASHHSRCARVVP